MRDSIDEHESMRWLALRQRLMELRSLLESQGSLVRRMKRGQGYWYLRYYEPQPGGRRQRTIYVGGDDQARRVQDLLDQFRAPNQFMDETLKLIAVARRLVRPLLQRNRPDEQESADGSGDP
jgi:hypothetical protein